MPYSAGPGGVGAGVDFLASFIAGRNQQQQQNVENVQQQRESAARLAALQNQARMQQQEMQQRAQQMQIDKQRLGLEERGAGVDPATGQPFQYQQMNEATSAKSSPEHRATVYHALAAQAVRNGDTKAASAFEAAAKNLEAAGARAKDESLKFAQFAERQIQDAAQRAHLHAQDAASAAHVAIAAQNMQIAAARLAEEVRNHSISAQQAQERLTIEGANLGLSLGRFKMEQGRYKMQQENHAATMAKEPMSLVSDAASEVKKIGTPQDQQALQDFLAHPENRAEYLRSPSVPDYMKRIFAKLKMFYPPMNPVQNLQKFLHPGT